MPAQSSAHSGVVLVCRRAGLLEFLAAEPYYHSPVWRGLLQNVYEEQGVGGLLSLRSLLRGVMLRRSKADVGELGRGRVGLGGAV